jgi:hypothetical protein
VRLPPLSQLKRSFLKQQEAFETQSPKEYFELLEGGAWLQQALQLLRVAGFAAWEYKSKGRSVIIDCREGVDRSAQVSTLMQVLLDSRCRTFEGLARLLELEFIELGHPFANRHNSTSEEAPVFLQLLECLQQLLHLYPLHFEFNATFLAELGFLSYSRMHGTFLFNCVREALKKGGGEMASAWEVLGRGEFLNPFYNEGLVDSLAPEVSAKGSRFFAELHGRLSTTGLVQGPSHEQALEEAHRQSRARLEQSTSEGITRPAEGD